MMAWTCGKPARSQPLPNGSVSTVELRLPETVFVPSRPLGRVMVKSTDQVCVPAPADCCRAGSPLDTARSVGRFRERDRGIDTVKGDVGRRPSRPSASRRGESRRRRNSGWFPGSRWHRYCS